MDNVAFSKPYIRENIIAFYNDPNKYAGLSVKTLSADNGATIRGAITEKYLSSSKRFLIDDAKTLIEFVRRGRADFGVLPFTIYDRAQKQLSEPVKFSYHIIDVVEACAAVSKSSPVASQMDYINEALENIELRQY
jgi:hypothetical protein